MNIQLHSTTLPLKQYTLPGRVRLVLRGSSRMSQKMRHHIYTIAQPLNCIPNGVECQAINIVIFRNFELASGLSNHFLDTDLINVNTNVWQLKETADIYRIVTRNFQ